MKAVTIREHGGPEVVQIRDVPDPQPAAGEVVVDIRAAALNHLDLWVRKGRPGMNLKFPHILGSDGANLDPVVDSAAPLDRAAEAMARMEAGEQFGKIVLTMGD